MPHLRLGVLQVLLKELFDSVHVLLESDWLTREENHEEVACDFRANLWALVFCFIVDARDESNGANGQVNFDERSFLTYLIEREQMIAATTEWWAFSAITLLAL